ncbi:MAG: glycosyltransferase family 4 protein [Clostridiales bacterium]|nr:glycosyltransferase family 4 protein [Clostridiales bacterium]
MEKLSKVPSLLHVLSLSTPAGVQNQAYRFMKNSNSSFNHNLLLLERHIHPKFQEFVEQNCRINFYKHFWGGIKIPKYPSYLRAFFTARWNRSIQNDFSIIYNELHRSSLIKGLMDSTQKKTIYYDQGSSWSQPMKPNKLAQSLDHIIAISNASRNMLTKKLGVNPNQITQIPNSIPKEEAEQINQFSNQTSPFNEKLADKYKMLFIGRLELQKGVNSIIRMCQHLPEDYHLFIAGDGDERNHLADLACHLEVENQVTFLGFQPDPKKFLKSADVMLVPSVYEPFGIVVLEGGAAKLPVVASNIDGISDIIDNEKNGLLISPNIPPERFKNDINKFDSLPPVVYNPDSGQLINPQFLDPKILAEKVRWLKKHSTQAQKLGENLYNRVESTFTMTHTVQKITDLLEKLS